MRYSLYVLPFTDADSEWRLITKETVYISVEILSHPPLYFEIALLFVKRSISYLIDKTGSLLCIYKN